jgi:hypothetical protein
MSWSDREQQMNKLDNLLEILVSRHAANMGLSNDLVDQMVKEINICTMRGYNTRAELIMLVKKELVTA